MYVEEKIDLLLKEILNLKSDIKLFLPDLTTQKGVIHFLEITKNTFDNYINNNIFEEGIHYYKDKDKRVFYSDEIINFKKSGQVGRKRKDSNKDALEGVKHILDIFSGSKSAEKGIL